MAVGPPREVALLDAAAARAGDAAAAASGDSWQQLMERAAGHLARGVVRHAGFGYGLKVVLVVGRGDNGGDGWAAARRLQRDHGAQPWIVAPDGVDTDLSEASHANRAWWLEQGGRTSGIASLDAALAWADVAVDALLGTGSRGAPRGLVADAVRSLRHAHAAGLTTVACDVPTGVDADTGATSNAVRADLTITFGGLKRGLLLHPGAAHCGRVVIGDLGRHYTPSPTSWVALTPAGAAPSPFSFDVDKRSRGVVLGVAGSDSMAGAAALAGNAALRSGAGLVTLVVPAGAHVRVGALADAGVMVRALPAGADPDGALADIDVSADAVVAGPGLGHGPHVRSWVDHLRAHTRRLVLDADALNAYRDDPDRLADHAAALVLTPHDRELARLGGDPDDKARSVPELAGRLNATVVAKGPSTMVAAPDGRVWVCPLGSPALGSGGTGDVLSGIVAAAVARADDVPLAAAQAVWWHAAAGELAGAASASRATASDVLTALPHVLQGLAAYDSRTNRGRAGMLPWDGWRHDNMLSGAS